MTDTKNAAPSRGNLTDEEREIKRQSMARGRYCYVPVIRQDDSYSLGIAVEGIGGYFPTDYPGVETYEKAQQWADTLNARRDDITTDDIADIIISSMREQGLTARIY